MGVTVYTKPTALTGGGAALDGISASALATGDEAFVEEGGVAYRFKYNATSSDPEASPDVVAPDDAGATGRWLLQVAYQPAASESQAGTIPLATEAEAAAGTDDSKAMTPAKGVALVQAVLDEADATESVPGLVELADDAEAAAGTDDSKAMTPKKVKDVMDAALGDLGPTEDLRTLLDNTFNGLLARSQTGVEGAWNVEAVLPFTPTGAGTSSSQGATCAYVINSALTSGTVYGSSVRVDEDVFGLVVDDTGSPRLCTLVDVASTGSEIRQVRLHPKYGNIGANFTPSTTYAVVVCAEDATPAQDANGDLAVTEYIPGTDVDTVAEFETLIGGSAPQPGSLVPGYWSGKTWTDNRPNGSRTVFRLGRRCNAAGDITSVHIGATSYSVVTAAPAAGEVQFTASQSLLTFPSAPASSDSIKVVYKVLARRLRPVNNPTGVQVLGSVYVSNYYSANFGPDLLWEIIGTVPTGNWANRLNPTSLGVLDPSTGGLKTWGVPTFPSSYTLTGNSNGAVLYFGLYASAGTWRVVIWAKELVLDTDWGDSGELPIENNAFTDTDDNGNVIMLGCWEFDTGIEAA